MVGESKIIGIIECLLYVAGDEGLSLTEMMKSIDVEQDVLETSIKSLLLRYEQKEHGLMIQKTMDRYYLTTKREYSSYIQALISTNKMHSLSQAALETLAIVAYKQPITRIEVEEIRGVKTDKAIQTLVSKALVKEVGRKEGTGRPILYGTTEEFLRVFGLTTLDELPPLKELTEEQIEEQANLFFQSIEQTEDERTTS